MGDQRLAHALVARFDLDHLAGDAVAREIIRPVDRRQLGLFRALARLLDRGEIDRLRLVQQRHRRLERMRCLGRSVPGDQRRRVRGQPLAAIGQDEHGAIGGHRQLARGEGRCAIDRIGIARAHHGEVVERGFAQHRQCHRPRRLDPVPRHALVRQIVERPVAQLCRLLAPIGHHGGKGRAVEIDRPGGLIGDGVQQRDMRIECTRQIEHGIEPPGKTLVPGGVE